MAEFPDKVEGMPCLVHASKQFKETDIKANWYDAYYPHPDIKPIIKMKLLLKFRTDEDGNEIDDGNEPTMSWNDTPKDYVINIENEAIREWLNDKEYALHKSHFYFRVKEEAIYFKVKWC